MTPGARVAAAIAVLDQINDGTAAEQALTAWARGSRFAGSKDRAAVRDHVFDVLRARRSLGDGNGRSLMQRLALREGWPLASLFDGVGHAPAPLSDDETAALMAPLDLNAAASCDIPDWLWPQWQDSLGAQAGPVGISLQGRAEVFLRVNRRRTSVKDAIAMLADDGVSAVPHPTVAGCLRVTENPRKVKLATAYLDGQVELQDAASQFAIAAVPMAAGETVLDYCAGGGGKALGFADRADATVFAHDIDQGRMKDLPVRARRAGVTVQTLNTRDLATHAPFDVVFCDAPCSGAGTWRRTPDAKWRLTAERLAVLVQLQDEVIREAAPLVSADGILVYATCSVLKSENDDVVERFLKSNKDWVLHQSTQLFACDDGDGFFFAMLRRGNNNL